MWWFGTQRVQASRHRGGRIVLDTLPNETISPGKSVFEQTPGVFVRNTGWFGEKDQSTALPPSSANAQCRIHQGILTNLWGTFPPQTARSRNRTGAIGRMPAGIAPCSLRRTSDEPGPIVLPTPVRETFGQKGSADRWNVAVERRVSVLLPLSHHSIRPMPTTLPQSVREHMGEQVAADFSRWFAENVQQELVTNDEYREVLSHLDILEERFDHVEERFDRVDERLTRMEDRFDRMEDRFENRFEEVNQRFEGIDTKLDRMNDRILSMTRWIIGLIALFGTMVTVLLAVAQFGG